MLVRIFLFISALLFVIGAAILVSLVPPIYNSPVLLLIVQILIAVPACVLFEAAIFTNSNAENNLYR